MCQTQKDAELKAEEVARILEQQSCWSDTKYNPIFHKFVTFKYAMKDMCDLYVADNVARAWPCRAVANKAKRLRDTKTKKYWKEDCGWLI